MNWTPHVTVAAIICQDNRFLLVEEQCFGGIVLNQPAGHWEANETLIEAVSREVLEETAWQFLPTAITGIYTYTSVHDTTYLRISFAGQHSQFDAHRQLDTGILRTLWLTRDEIAQVNNMRSPLVLHCIDDYLQQEHYPLSLLRSLK
jgi:ADP-ribose pyrophosphatase YjhB (NUDIX family)